MTELLPVILINLIVSCDNVGVIALATKGLPDKEARIARQVGVWLSLLMKLVFILIAGYLFQLPWLHIRIIGGVLLLYVTYTMLKPQGERKERGRHGHEGSLAFALASIIAADVSMSLDNVIAILGVVTADGRSLTGTDLLVVAIGLAVCVPLLLWGSGVVTRLMERYKLLTYVCAGYLVYLSLKMISEDETIAFFLSQAHITFAIPAAALCGALVVVFGVFEGRRKGLGRERHRARRLLVYAAVVVYALVLVGVISYFSTNPNIEGVSFSVEKLYGFGPEGSNAIYLIASSTHLLLLCFILRIGSAAHWQEYGKAFKRGGKELAKLAALMFFVCTAGLTYSFGFGRLEPARLLASFFMQVLILLSHASIILCIRVKTQGNASFVVFSMLYVLLEAMFAELLFHSGQSFLAGFFPTYYAETLYLQVQDVYAFIRLLLVCTAYTAAGITLGREGDVKNRRMSSGG